MRQTSSTLVPSSAWRRMNAICCSLKFDLFTARSPVGHRKPNREFTIRGPDPGKQVKVRMPRKRYSDRQNGKFSVAIDTALALTCLCPVPRPVESAKAGKIIALPQVGGLHHRYERLAPERRSHHCGQQSHRSAGGFRPCGRQARRCRIDWRMAPVGAGPFYPDIESARPLPREDTRSPLSATGLSFWEGQPDRHPEPDRRHALHVILQRSNALELHPGNPDRHSSRRLTARRLRLNR